MKPVNVSMRGHSRQLGSLAAAFFSCGVATGSFALAVVTDWDDPLPNHHRSSVSSVVQAVKPDARPAAKPAAPLPVTPAAQTVQSDAQKSKVKCPKSDAEPENAGIYQTAVPRPPALDRPLVNTQRRGN